MITFLTFSFLMVAPYLAFNVEETSSSDFTCEGVGEFALPEPGHFVQCKQLPTGELHLTFINCEYDNSSRKVEANCTELFDKVQAELQHRGQVIGDKCLRQGYFCTDCKILNYCEFNGEEYEVTETHQCKDDEFCSDYTNSCRRGTAPPQCSDDYEFKCHQMGLYPDPYKCDIFYFCASGQSEAVRSECPADSYYDALNYECTPYKPDVDPPCPPMRECTSGYDRYSLHSNPNIFYMCSETDVQILPRKYRTDVYRCPSGKIYSTYGCLDPSPPIDMSGLF